MKIVEKILNTIDEGKTKRLKHTLFNPNYPVHTFAVLTSANPMGVKQTRGDNKNLIKDLTAYMDSGGFDYFPLSYGKYGSKEPSYIVLNVSLDTATRISKEYNQESFLFVERTGNERKWNYQYWLSKDPEKFPYKKIDEYSGPLDTNMGDEDFFSRLKNFKFKVPFPSFGESIENHTKQAGVLSKDTLYLLEELISEVYKNGLAENYHMYACRKRFKTIILTRKLCY